MHDSQTKGDIYGRLVMPEGGENPSITKAEGEFIHSFLKETRVKDTLEIGFAYGVSAAYIMSATNRRHIAIDPCARESGSGLKNLKRLGLAKRFKLVTDYSHNVLPKLFAEGAGFDFVFIDGEHKFDFVFVDFYYADLLLDDGGYVMFHDTWMPSIHLVTSWIRKNKENYVQVKVPEGNLVLFKKNGKDGRDWWQFREFYNLPTLKVRHMVYVLKRKFLAWHPRDNP
jgi:predicted O-methyltransferase YrrM